MTITKTIHETSSCCGAEMTKIDVAVELCPTCHEHCSAEKEANLTFA